MAKKGYFDPLRISRKFVRHFLNYLSSALCEILIEFLSPPEVDFFLGFGFSGVIISCFKAVKLS